MIKPALLVKRLIWTLDKPTQRLPFVWRLSGVDKSPDEQWAEVQG